MSKFIQKILREGYEFPFQIKKLQGEHFKNLNINSIFKNKFVQAHRDKWKKLEEKYYANRGRKKYGGDFSETGTVNTFVKVNNIYPGQIGVSDEILLNKMNDKDEGNPSSELPEAVKIYDNKLAKFIVLLTDGHHRVAEAILKGKTEVELKLKVKDFE